MIQDQLDSNLPINILHDEIIAVTIQETKSELTPLINQTKPSKIYTVTVITIWGSFSAIVASPSAFLNLLGGLKIPINKLNSVADLKEFIDQHSLGEITYATWLGTCSEIVNTAINIVYLGPALNKTSKVFVKAFNTCRFRNAEQPIEKLESIDVISCIWAFGTALAYAQIAKDEFNFIGKIWSYLPFSFNGLAVFATRFKGVEGFLQGCFDKKEKFKQTILKFLLFAKEKEKFSVAVDLNEKNITKRLNDALIVFLKKFFNEKNHDFNKSTYFEKNTVQGRLEIIAKLTGIPAALIIVLPIWPLVTQITVEALESMTNLDIGKSHNYQNFSALSLGYVLSAPTPFFYGMAIKNLPAEIIQAIKNLYAYYKNGERFKLAAATGLILLLGYMSYLCGKGWEDIAETALKEGY